MADPERHRLVQTMIVDQLVRHGRAASAEALVRFLQGDDVGIELGDDRCHAVRIVAPISADARVNVVRSDSH